MKVVFDSLLIVDVIKKEAKQIDFRLGMNVITGSKNHVGKSSLMKSLYYSLGAEIHFDERWELFSKMTKLSFHNENGNYAILRFREKYWIFQNDHFFCSVDSTGDLRDYVPDIFGNSFYTRVKKSEGYHKAYPVLYYLPYYIDQDDGWGTKSFMSFKGLGMYDKNILVDALYEHLGANISDKYQEIEEYDKLLKELNTIERNITKTEGTIEILKSTIGNNVLTDDIQFIRETMSESKNEINKLVREINKSREKILKIEAGIADLNRSISVIYDYNKIKSNYVDLVDNKKNLCPNCGFDLNNSIYEQVRNNYFKLNEQMLIGRIKDQKRKLEKELKGELEKYKELQNQMNSLIENSEMKPFEDISKLLVISETIVSLQNDLRNMKCIEKDLRKKKSTLDKDIHYEEVKAQIDQEFKSNYNKRMKSLTLDDGNSVEKSIKLGMNFSGQGTVITKGIMCYYTAFFDTVVQRNCPFTLFPFLIDSPKSKEASKETSKVIFENMSDLGLEQIIVSTVDYSDELVDKKPNIIILDKQYHLLNSDEYQCHKGEIEQLSALVGFE